MAVNGNGTVYYKFAIFSFVNKNGEVTIKEEGPYRPLILPTYGLLRRCVVRRPGSGPCITMDSEGCEACFV